MKNILSAIILCLSTLSVYPSIWQRQITNYDRNMYQAGFQNWMITQSGNGWLYIANSNGLLEFDGVYWNLYPMNGKIVRCIKISGERIYVGGSSEFGYFAPKENGQLVYTSLSNPHRQWGGEVWNILEAGGKLYFIDEYYIQIFEGDKLQKRIESQTKIDCSAVINGRVYVGTPKGIYNVDNEGRLQWHSESKALEGDKIVELLPYDGQLLIVTALSGIYNMKEGQLKRISSSADSFINENQLFCASINGNQLVLGSIQNGALLVDLKNGTSAESFNLKRGLKNNTILKTFFDIEGNLWLGMDKGISRIDLKSPILPMFATESPIGTGYCSAIYNGELYLGTNQGIYKVTGDGHFLPIADSEGQIWSMLLYDNSLFCSGDNGIVVIGNRGTYKIKQRGAWEVQPMKTDRNKLIVGTYSGFSILEKKGASWLFSHHIEQFYSSTRGFIEDDVPNVFWVTDRGNIQKVTLSEDIANVKEIKSYLLNGIALKENTFYRRVDNNLIICTEGGIYIYSRLTDDFNRHIQLESLLNGAAYYRYLYVDQLKNIWFVKDRELSFLEYTSKGYSKKIQSWDFHNQLIDNYENVMLTDSSMAVIAIDNAFVKLDLHNNREAKMPDAFIRRIKTSKKDSIVCYNGIGTFTLPYTDNTINIYYGSTDFAENSNTLYSYRLRDLEPDWSIPSGKTSKEYTNLHEGEYVFEVKTVSIDGEKEGKVIRIPFRVLPPWYRSIWMYCLYCIIILVVFYIIYKKTVSKQKKELRLKKDELRRQSVRHEIERKLKDQEIYTLQNERLRQDLHYKTQELTGYILNLQRKNEILEGLKKNVLTILKAIDEKKEPSEIKQRSTRLISLINSNIEHDKDFEVFESNFDSIHQGFFKILDKKYPQLSKNDRVLCAYLKMNLSTKEIAPLLNISVRGVEITRYRLRKKMNLNRDINLNEFMQNLADK